MMIKKIIYFIIVIIFSDSNAQQFGQEIIIALNQINSFPAIDLDTNGNLGIVWGVDGFPDDTVKFLKSIDGGLSFDSIKIVDVLPLYPDAGYPRAPLILFDPFDNPIVFYVRWYFPFSYFHYYKKSNDGGITFPSQRFSFLSRNNFIDFIYLTTDTTLLGYSYYPTQNVMVKRSINAGQSYNDSTLLVTGSSSPQRNISFTICGNTNILCSYTAFNTSDSKIYYHRSTDLGFTFSTKIQLDSAYQYHNGGIMQSFQNYVFLISSADGDTITPKIVFYKSTDFGHTFSIKKVIFDYGNVSLTTYSEPTLVFNENVGICLLWNEYRGLIDRTWFTYSDDLGESFYPPVIVTEGDQWVTAKAMAVSDSGDVYITYLNNNSKNVVLRKAKLPVLTNIFTSHSQISESMLLLNNYPNPFNSSTQISFQLSKNELIDLSVYDLQGRKVISLVHKTLSQGEYVISWDGKDNNNREVSSGIYLVRFSTNHKILGKKLIYIK